MGRMLRLWCVALIFIIDGIPSDHTQKWILDYFSNPPPNRNGKKRVENTAFEKIQQSPIKLTHRQPLYLQHEGHSRTVIGVDQGKGSDFLLIFDPSESVSSPTTERCS